MKRKRSYLDSIEKLLIIEEVLRGKISKEGARQKYKIKGKSAILKWMRKFGLAGYKQLPAYFERMKEEEKSDQEALLKRIRELERKLEDAEIKAFGYSRMIDIAERELKISIRKKQFTKQSKK